MKKTDSVSNFQILKFSDGIFTETGDQTAIEEPLEISLVYNQDDRIVKKNISITMRSPGHDHLLASGFLFTEGIIKNMNEIERWHQTGENSIDIYLNHTHVPELQKLERHFYTSSSCGVCGKSSIESLRTVSHEYRIDDQVKFRSDIILKLDKLVREKQAVFESTGGLHASALFDSEGNILVLYEDVGRHNALDKLIGSALLDSECPLKGKLLFLSGRACFELIQKAAMAGIPVICALGAPSSLAIELAREFNISLIGFLKKNSFNIYSSPERIIA